MVHYTIKTDIKTALNAALMWARCRADLFYLPDFLKEGNALLHVSPQKKALPHSTFITFHFPLSQFFMKLSNKCYIGQHGSFVP